MKKTERLPQTLWLSNFGNQFGKARLSMVQLVDWKNEWLKMTTCYSFYWRESQSRKQFCQQSPSPPPPKKTILWTYVLNIHVLKLNFYFSLPHFYCQPTFKRLEHFFSFSQLFVQSRTKCQRNWHSLMCRRFWTRDRCYDF
jgi:hypothetical protein